MTWRKRVSHAVIPVRTFWWFVLFVVRALVGVAVGIGVGLGVARGIFCPLMPGHTVLAISAGAFSFYIVMFSFFADRGWPWWKAGPLRVFLLGLFVSVTVIARRSLEVLVVGHYQHLGLLHDHPEVLRVPFALTIGMLAVQCSANFIVGPRETVRYDGPVGDERVIRGTRYVPYLVVKATYAALVGPADPYIIWLWVKMPLLLAVRGLLLVGSPGTGKTVLLQMLLYDWFSQAERFLGVCDRFGITRFSTVIADPQNELIALCRSRLKNSPLRIHHIHPFDQRGEAVSFASYPKSMYRELAMAFYPALPPGANEAATFFYNALISTTTAMLNGLRKLYGPELILADLYEYACTYEGIIELVSADPDDGDNASTLSMYTRAADQKLSANIMATITATLSPFKEALAGMREQLRRGQRFDPITFRKEGGVAVTGWDSNRAEQCCLLFALFFRLTRRSVLAEPESIDGDRGTLIVLDETTSVVKHIVEEMELMQMQGRKRGAVLVLAIHSKSILTRAVGSAEAAEAIMALPLHVAGLKVTDQLTGEWLAKRYSGNGTEIERTRASHTKQADGKVSVNTEVIREIKDLVSSGQFLVRDSINGDENKGIVAYGNDDEGNVFVVGSPLATIKRDFPRAAPFVAVPFDEADLHLTPRRPVTSPQATEDIESAPQATAVDAELLRELQRWAEENITASDVDAVAMTPVPPTPHNGASTAKPAKPRRKRRAPKPEPAGESDDSGLPYEKHDQEA